MTAQNSNLNALKILQEIYNIDQLTSGPAYIKELVQRLAEILRVKFVMVGHAIEPHRDKVQSDFLWAGGKFVDNVVYDLKNTPCVHVLCGTRVNCYPCGVTDIFPEDQMLKDLRVESYIGAPFLLADGTLLGLLVIMDDKPMTDRELYTSVVEFFAARIGTEYRRQFVEDSLRRNNERLESSVQERTQALQRAIEELKRTQKQLISQEKLATIGRITFGIAHELKNPLNVVINAAEILEEADLEGLPPEARKKALTLIRHHGQRANHIINTMLKQARRDSGLKVEKASLSRRLHHALDLCLRSVTDSEFKSRLKVKQNIPVRISLNLVDADSLEGVFINLIDNAIYALKQKFQNEGPGYTPELTVDLVRVSEGAVIHVKDNGIGIPERAKKHLFDEFYTTKPPGEGTGLGLWVAKQNIEKNSGELLLNSREHEFTEVTVRLPNHEIHPAAQEAAP